MPVVKIFYESNDDEFKNFVSYNNVWEENYQKLIFLQLNLKHKHMITNLVKSIKDHPDRNILAIRFPKEGVHKFMKSELMVYLIKGNGIEYQTQRDSNSEIKTLKWFPSEIWFYSNKF